MGESRNTLLQRWVALRKLLRSPPTLDHPYDPDAAERELREVEDLLEIDARSDAALSGAIPTDPSSFLAQILGTALGTLTENALRKAVLKPATPTTVPAICPYCRNPMPGAHRPNCTQLKRVHRMKKRLRNRKP